MLRQGAFRPNRKESGQYHSNWLNMMLPRLYLARNLLRDDGVIFVSIDDNEAANLKLLMDEVFGEGNFIAQLAVQLNPRGRHLDQFVAKTHESIFIYGKTLELETTMSGIDKDERMTNEYNREDNRGFYRLLGLRNRNQAFNPVTRPTLFYALYVNPKTNQVSINQDSDYSDEVLPITTEGVKTCWTWGKEKVRNDGALLTAEKTSNEWRVFRKDYLVDINGETAKTLIKSVFIDNEITNDYGSRAVKELFGSSVMSFPKSIALIKILLNVGCSKNDLVLDFFAGSGTTAQAVMELNEKDGGNRRYICVQLSEKTDENSEASKAGYTSIADITTARIQKVIAKIQAERATKTDLLTDEKTLPSLGFRKFTLAPSNFKLWRGDVIETEEDLMKQMQLFSKPQRENVTSLNMAWELLLKNKIELTDAVQVIALEDDLKIYHTSNNQIALVLDGYSDSVQKALLQLAPKQVFLLDSIFATHKNGDSLKTNAQLTCEDQGIAFKTI